MTEQTTLTLQQAQAATVAEMRAKNLLVMQQSISLKRFKTAQAADLKPLTKAINAALARETSISRKLSKAASIKAAEEAEPKAGADAAE